MQRLISIVQEKKTLRPPSAGSALASASNPPDRVCWLCACRPKWFFSFGDMELCFTCCRLAVQAHVMPLLLTHTRRHRDAGVLAGIQRVKAHSAVSRRRAEDTVAVTVPSQANFARRASAVRVGRVLSPSAFTCADCGELCVGAGGDAPRLSFCAVRRAFHVRWRCASCGGANGVDGDACGVCSAPRRWACARCTSEQCGGRAEGELRVCATCRSYNTPLEVLAATEALQRERLAQQQQQQEEEEEVMTGEEFGVNDAETLQEMARQSEMEAARGRLQERVRGLGISGMNEQKPDGNCLFRALANQLFGTPEMHLLVRRLVVCYMQSRGEDYAVLFDGDAEWGAYLESMLQAGCWGDELCLNAAARCFCVNIHVITSDASRWHIVFQHDELSDSHALLQLPDVAAPPAGPSLPGGDEALCLFLAYQAPVHYNDLMPPPRLNVLPIGPFVAKRLREMVAERQRESPPAQRNHSEGKRTHTQSVSPPHTSPSEERGALNRSKESDGAVPPPPEKPSRRAEHHMSQKSPTTPNLTSPPPLSVPQRRGTS